MAPPAKCRRGEHTLAPFPPPLDDGVVGDGDDDEESTAYYSKLSK